LQYANRAIEPTGPLDDLRRLQRSDDLFHELAVDFESLATTQSRVACTSSPTKSVKRPVSASTKRKKSGSRGRVFPVSHLETAYRDAPTRELRSTIDVSQRREPPCNSQIAVRKGSRRWSVKSLDCLLDVNPHYFAQTQRLCSGRKTPTSLPKSHRIAAVTESRGQRSLGTASGHHRITSQSGRLLQANAGGALVAPIAEVNWVRKRFHVVDRADHVFVELHPHEVATAGIER